MVGRNGAWYRCFVLLFRTEVSCWGLVPFLRQPLAALGVQRPRSAALSIVFATPAKSVILARKFDAAVLKRCGPGLPHGLVAQTTQWGNAKWLGTVRTEQQMVGESWTTT